MTQDTSGDRELLELAAKAAGIALEWRYDWRGNSLEEPWHNEEIWNPLTDDGDALRLAVTLNINFNLSGKHAAVAQPGSAVVQQYRNGDPYAATRRAIVRAAAEIGRQMEGGAA